MGCGGSKLPNMSASSRNFWLMIQSKPNLLKYAKSLENNKTLVKSISSVVFGGSVLLPVGAKGKKRDKKNPMYDEIVSTNTDVIYGGGYYQLPNIRMSEESQNMVDVYMLVESIKDSALLHKVKLINDHYVQSLELKTKKKLNDVGTSKIGDTEFNQIFWDDIKDAITGKARIIKYVNHNIIANFKVDNEEEKSKTHKALKMDPAELEIKEIEEGSYENG